MFSKLRKEKLVKEEEKKGKCDKVSKNERDNTTCLIDANLGEDLLKCDGVWQSSSYRLGFAEGRFVYVVDRIEIPCLFLYRTLS